MFHCRIASTIRLLRLLAREVQRRFKWNPVHLASFAAGWLCFASMVIAQSASDPGISGESPTPQPDTAQQDLTSLSNWSDQRLIDALENLSPAGLSNEGELHRELVLTEMIARKNPRFATELREKLWRDRKRAAVERENLKQIQSLRPSSIEYTQQVALTYRLENQLDVLTALRRLENQPDPLGVLSASGDTPVQGRTRELPKISVTLKNVDINQMPFRFKAGGNYRSGRHARWRIHVWDADGHLLPVKENNNRLSAGGIHDRRTFQTGDQWQLDLPLADYLRPLPPGKYSLQILYHNEIPIADLQPAELEGLLIHRSQKILLWINPSPKTTIRITLEDQQRARDHIRNLSDDDEVRIVLGRYSESSHEFLKPDSPAAKLLRMGFQSVPVLIDALDDQEISPRKRGWLLLILYSITMESELNPMQSIHPRECILPSYRYKTPGGSGSVRHSHPINQAKQLEFAKRWQDFATLQLDVRSE